MKLYYSPGSCALGVHILLEEISEPFTLHRVNFAEREQFSPAFMAVNPKSRVPALALDDRSVLTEYEAISLYLALSHPQMRLLPTGPLAQARMWEALEYIVGMVHAQGFRRLFRTADFAPGEADHDAVKARGIEIIKAGFAIVDKSLDGGGWVAADYSIADPALFYVSYWALERIKIDLPPQIRNHYERMRARPAVRKALDEEGLGDP